MFNKKFPESVEKFFFNNKTQKPQHAVNKKLTGKDIYELEDLPWLYLPLKFPYEKIYLEAKPFINDMIAQSYSELFDKQRPDKNILNHQQETSKGWNTICVHGLGQHHFDRAYTYGYETENDAPYEFTEIAKQCPYTVKFLKSLPYKKLYRARFTALTPGGYAAPHIGRKQGAEYSHKWNFALNHPDGFEFTLDKAGNIPWKAGRSFLINADNYYHSVVNDSDVVRIHLITMGEPDFDKMHSLLTSAYQSNNPWGLYG